MTSWKNALGLGALALALFGLTPACASAPGDEGSTTDESSDELNKSCGGIANIQCPGGYACDITDTHPDATGLCRKECGGVAGLQCHSGYQCDLESNAPDAMGICHKKGDAGPSCGKAALTTTCAQGYHFDTTKCDCEPDHPSWYACNQDSDCTAVERVGCCPNGINEAVNKHHATDYENSFVCQTHQMCPLYVILDTRQPECNLGTNRCEMVDIDKIACGGFTMHPHSCPSGYTCQLPSNIPDAPGKCVKQACVQTQACTLFSHWDSTQCACVQNPGCGGFAGLACPSGYSKCVDNPNDGCDPAHGGADCPGICEK